MIMLALTLLSPMPTATIGGKKKKTFVILKCILLQLLWLTTFNQKVTKPIEVWIIKVKPNMKSIFILIGIFITSEISALIL